MADLHWMMREVHELIMLCVENGTPEQRVRARAALERPLPSGTVELLVVANRVVGLEVARAAYREAYGEEIRAPVLDA